MFLNNKKFLLGVLGVFSLVLGFWLLLAPGAEAAPIEAEFIRIKIDSTSGGDGKTQLFNFFATDNGSFNDFFITGHYYIDTSTDPDTEYPDYTCGLLLTEEFGFGFNDDDYILWAKKGTILGEKGSLFADVTNYKACCKESNMFSDACTINTNGNCESKVYTDANYVFQKAYGTLNEDKCADDVNVAPCDNTPDTCCALSKEHSTGKYEFEYQALCSDTGKWILADGEALCASDGTYDYKFTGLDDGTGTWTKCAAGCTDGVCGGGGEICDNDDILDPGEQCDKNQLGGKTCVTQGFTGGILKCKTDCTFDTSGCIGEGGGEGGGIIFRPPGKYKDLLELVDAIVSALFYIAAAVAILLLVIAGFLFLTVGGDPQKMNTAKTLVFYTLLGLMIILLSKAIAAVIKFAVS